MSAVRHLFLCRTCGEQHRDVVEKLPRGSVRLRHRDKLLLEEEPTTNTRRVHRRPRQHVLLPAIRNRSEPLARVRTSQEGANEVLLPLAGVLIPRRCIVEMRVVTPIPTDCLPLFRWPPRHWREPSTDLNTPLTHHRTRRSHSACERSETRPDPPIHGSPTRRDAATQPAHVSVGKRVTVFPRRAAKELPDDGGCTHHFSTIFATRLRMRSTSQAR